MDAKAEGQILAALGQIQGELKGLRDLMSSSNSSLHQRINDIHTSNEARFQNVEKRVEKLETDHKTLLIRTAAGGGIAGTVAAVLMEIIRIKS